MTDQFRGVFLSISRLNSLRQRIEEQVSPSYEAFAILESQAQGLLNHKIDLPALWHVPGFYKNSVAHDRVRSTLERAANAAYGLALLYQITGHLHYCQAAIRLIRAWIQYPIEYSTADDSTLCFCYHFPAFLFAEPLISESNAWSAEDRERFSSFISTTAMSMSCSGKQNNWGAWGNLLETAVGANLGDAELIARAGRRWTE